MMRFLFSREPDSFIKNQSVHFLEVIRISRFSVIVYSGDKMYIAVKLV